MPLNAHSVGCPGSDFDDLIASVRSLTLEYGVFLLPINNNGDVELACGGSHWSLLVYVSWAPRRSRFWHVDSLRDSGNRELANKIAHVITSVVGTTKRSGHAAEIEEALVLEIEGCARQRNEYDCGACVLEQCQRVATYFQDIYHLPEAEKATMIDPDVAGPLREILSTEFDSCLLRRKIRAKIESQQRV